jgi:heme/copper-type cytochrome/quinol oxidase subunit 2
VKFKHVVVYGKLIAIVAVLMTAAVVVFQNRNYSTKFWPGAADEEVSTLWLMLWTAILSIVVFWTLTRVIRVVKQVNRVRLEQEAARKADENEKRRRELDDQERRIDKKIKSALDGPGNDEP